LIELQDARPDVASLALTPMKSGWLYQPFESGPRALIPEITGGAESFFTVALALDVVEPTESVKITTQFRVTPVVSDDCV
jgi:hypothetical protein